MCTMHFAVVVQWMAGQPLAITAAVSGGEREREAGRVAPGGRLVYSVCSLEPEEGEAQIQGFLADHPDFSLDALSPGEGGAPAESRRRGRRQRRWRRLHRMRRRPLLRREEARRQRRRAGPWTSISRCVMGPAAAVDG